ncbi:hypothetical protein EDC01DRAFT_776054 [Geopyxis carbonaria]|nr:hypothetical protein EDC01DRAFT_776054 [Geopyxis carbonaria]
MSTTTATMTETAPPFYETWNLLPEKRYTPTAIPTGDAATAYTARELMVECWVLHAIARAAEATPASETRIRSALHVLYKNTNQTHQDTLAILSAPPAGFKPAHPDMHLEATTVADTDVVAAITAHLTPPAKNHVNSVAAALAGDAHWTTPVAYIAAVFDIYVWSLAKGQGSHFDFCVNDPVRAEAKWVDKFACEEVMQSLEVLMAELKRLRESEDSGWREEEARELVTVVMKNSFEEYPI